MFRFMTENGRLKKRYGDSLDSRWLSDEQRAFFLDPRVKDNQDPMGNYTVQRTTSEVLEVHFVFDDIYRFDTHDDSVHWSDYASLRNGIYKDIFGRTPEVSGTHESRYRLAEGTLISITIDAEDKTPRSERRPTGR